ncbi:4Fe-4S dicluster domain-containing protein [bacterium]|nr:4Fe-4S dicluster domain-containing protein [bacterium]MBU1073204.1 4Fe-4S dicluster domain-containing protein [bacterium]MBU1674715.1 4Fe-4S dicluster domain-containing protein [bacterium]
MDRRRFLTLASLATMAGFASLACNTKPGFVEDLLRRRFTELGPADLDRILRGLEEEYREKYHRAVSVSAAPALDDVEFGYGLDLSRCVGCRRCTYACVHENNQSRDPQIHWIQVLEMKEEAGLHLVEADQYYDPPLVPEEGFFYIPIACQQCRNPACVRSCPVKATWQEPDGIVVIDYDWCIGCRCCMAACPYGARHFNWAEPGLPPEELNPDTHYLGNRPRPSGVVEKCTFCIHRTRKGRYPACVEICPVGARKFGNLLDEESEIRYIMREKRIFVLKEELNTKPRFYYFYAT